MKSSASHRRSSPSSARRALLSRPTGLDKEQLCQESNFGQLEDHVSMMVGRERTRMLKLASTCQTGSLILSDSVQRIRSCPGTIVRNETQLAGLQSTLQARKDQTLRQIAGFLRGIEQACRICEDKGEHPAKSAVLLANVATGLG